MATTIHVVYRTLRIDEKPSERKFCSIPFLGTSIEQISAVDLDSGINAEIR